MHFEANRRFSRLVAIFDDDTAALNRYARACEAAGWRVTTTTERGLEIAADGDLDAVVISLASDRGLRLLLGLATVPHTNHIPVVVSACRSEHARMRAEQTGSVVMFLEWPAPATLAAAITAIADRRDDPAEFPARCPQCGAAAGTPRSVSTAAQAATYVGLACAACGLDWRVLRERTGRLRDGDLPREQRQA